MKIRKCLLSQNEMQLMDIFWQENRPMSGTDLSVFTEEFGWKSSYTYNLISSLIKKDMIEVCGFARCGKQYVRQFKPKMAKEEYAVQMTTLLNLDKDSVLKITLALAEEVSTSDEEVISQLEAIIEELKNKK